MVISATPGCQTDQARIIEERNKVVQQQLEHDKALEQAKKDLEKQSGATVTAPAGPDVPASPMAPLRSDKPKEEEVGFPIYPNSQLYKEAGNSMNSLHSSQGVTTLVLESLDKPAQVIAFYETKFTHLSTDPNLTDDKKFVKPQRQERTDNGIRVVKLTEVQENRTIRIVKVYPQTDKTLIELMNIQPTVPPGSVPNPPAAPTSAVPPTSNGGNSPADTTPMPPVPDTPNDPLKPTIPLPKRR